MAEKKKEEKNGGQPSTKEEHEAKLLSLLSPQGKRFARRLGRVLEEECASIRNEAGVAIMRAIGGHHLRTLDSVKSINKLAAAYTEPLVTSFYLIMNYSDILLTSGDYHLSKGELNVTGQRLFEIWRIYAHRLVDMGEETAEQIAARETVLNKRIAELGSNGFSLIGAVKSLFGKKKAK